MALSRLLVGFLFVCIAGTAAAAPVKQDWPNWQQWPDTDFSKHVVAPSDLMGGGPPKDGILAIDHPIFSPVALAQLGDKEPVIEIQIDGITKGYPVSILMWHEIANDMHGAHPIAVTFCPLCNTAIVFDRIVDGKTTTFGTSGLLRNSDLVMYDRATQSWWQQFTGRSILGAQAGNTLTRRPSKLVSFSQFKRANPHAQIMIPPTDSKHQYGRNPYVGYDSSNGMFEVSGKPPKGFTKMERVVVVGKEAWKMTSIAKAGSISHKGLRLTWTKGQASATDTGKIADGRDVGGVVVERKDAQGKWQLVNFDVTFAFAFASFVPDGIWHK